MRRFVRRLTILLVFALLGAVVVMPASAQATQTTYQEGISVSVVVRGGFFIRVEATKSVNGNTRSTRIFVNYDGMCLGYANLPGDPDELEVSNDLGWGGLNTPPLPFSDPLGRECHAEIHLSLYARGRAGWDSTHYSRSAARIQGTITIYHGSNREVFNFDPPSHVLYGESGYTFSTRAPFPD